MSLRSFGIAAICILGLTAAPLALGADEPRQGTYKGDGVEVDVDADDEAKLRYDLRTDCGATKGAIDLGRPRGGVYKGKRKSAGPGGSTRKTKVELEAVADGTVLEGTLKDGYDGPDRCEDKHKFEAELSKDDAFVPARDDGHYTGKNSQGLPVEFDVVREGDEIRIANFEADTEAECYPPGEIEPSDRIVHVSLPGGRVERDGSFEIAYEPNEDTSHVIIGWIGGGRAEIDLGVTGRFGPNGEWDPSLNGPLDCDSNEDDYRAGLAS
jgi:hypothetical protein